MVASEFDLVARKATVGGQASETACQAIRSFANDLPNDRRASVIYLGVDGGGAPTWLEIQDALSLKHADCLDKGQQRAASDDASHTTNAVRAGSSGDEGRNNLRRYAIAAGSGSRVNFSGPWLQFGTSVS